MCVQIIWSTETSHSFSLAESRQQSTGMGKHSGRPGREKGIDQEKQTEEVGGVVARQWQETGGTTDNLIQQHFPWQRRSAAYHLPRTSDSHCLETLSGWSS